MNVVRLGKTELQVSKNGFGALPIQRITKKEAAYLLQKAFYHGINYFDTARAYSDSEEKQPQFAHVAPIWGMQKESELDEFLAHAACPPVLDENLRAEIQKDIEQLSGEFCRGCGYCMPCPAGIEINNCARMSLMLRRAPEANWLSEEWQEKMAKIEDCLHCGQCMKKCPYGLNTPELLAKNYEDYKTFL